MATVRCFSSRRRKQQAPRTPRLPTEQVARCQCLSDPRRPAPPQRTCLKTRSQELGETCRKLLHKVSEVQIKTPGGTARSVRARPSGLDKIAPDVISFALRQERKCIFSLDNFKKVVVWPQSAVQLCRHDFAPAVN